MKKLLFVFTIIFLVIAHQLVQAQSKKAKELKQDYLEVAFLETSGGIKHPLTKWEGIKVIDYYIEGDLQYLSNKQWKKFLDEVKSLTNLNFRRTTNRLDAEISIYFGELKEYFEKTESKMPVRLSEGLTNWSSRRWNSERQLTSTSYCIVPSEIDNSRTGDFYVRKLFLKSLGLLGNLDNEYSVYHRYYRSRNDDLRRSDKRLLKLHYNEKIKAGMRVKEVDALISNKIDLEKLADEKL